MKLCFVTHENGKLPSGVVTVIMELCKKWPDEDSITVLTNKKHWATGLLHERLCKKTGFRTVTLPITLPLEKSYSINQKNWPRWVILSLKILLRLTHWLMTPVILLWLTYWLRQEGIDGIVNHNGGWPGGALNRWIALAGKLAGIKHNYLVIHNTPASIRWFAKPMNYLSNRIIAWACKEIITVSNACRYSLENETGFGRSLKVIYNGIETVSIGSFNDSNLQLQPPWKKKNVSVGFVGELHPRKGVHVLLQAIAQVKTPCEVVLIGSGEHEYIEKLKKIADNCGHAVYFVGFRDDCLSLYKWLDIVVLPSLYGESFGMVLLEAMQYMKPVICSDFGGMKEVVVNDETGLIVMANDVEKLAYAINKLLADESLRNNMGQKGRKRLEEFFSAGIMVDNYRALFKCN